tara:strand:+ start:6056 stop:7804 length:1749 start_codon:yes stop_codon:yes gene_type:complete
MAIHLSELAAREVHGDECGHLIVLVVLNASAVKELATVTECAIDDINKVMVRKAAKGRTAILNVNGALFFRSFIPKENRVKNGRNKWKTRKEFRRAFFECSKKDVQVSFIIDECHKLTSTKMPKSQVLAKVFPNVNILGMTGTDTFQSNAQQKLYRKVMRPGGEEKFPVSSLKLVMTDEEYNGIQCELPINPEVQTVQLVGTRQLSPCSDTATNLAFLLSVRHANMQTVGVMPPDVHNCIRVVLQRHNDELFYGQMVEFLNATPYVGEDDVHPLGDLSSATEGGFYYQSAISTDSIAGQVKELSFAVQMADDRKFDSSLADAKVKKDTANVMAVVKASGERAHCVVITGNTSGADLRRSMKFFQERFASFAPSFTAEFFDATRGIGSFHNQRLDIYSAVYNKKVAFVFSNASIATSTNCLVGVVTAVAQRGLLSSSGETQLKGRISLRPITAPPLKRPKQLFYFQTVSQVLTDVNDYLKQKNEIEPQVDRTVTRSNKKARHSSQAPKDIEKEYPLNGQLDHALSQGNGIQDILSNKTKAKRTFMSLKERMANNEDDSKECEEEEGMDREDGLESDADSIDSD